eukprot:9249626-Alexandrium_andersonii.AAC.1
MPTLPPGRLRAAPRPRRTFSSAPSWTASGGAPRAPSSGSSTYLRNSTAPGSSSPATPSACTTS